MIPVANIYYLLCYAWDEFAPRRIAERDAEAFPDTLHLFSHLLVVGVRDPPPPGVGNWLRADGRADRYD